MKVRQWLRRWRTRRQLASGLREAAAEQLANGEMDNAEYNKCMRASKDVAALDEMALQFEVNKDALGAIDWEAIKDWFIANWPAILKIVLSVLVLLEARRGDYE